MGTVRGRVVLFFLVTYALTWLGWLGNWLAPGPYWPLPMNPLGPLMAAPLVLWWTEGRAGLAAWWRRILRFRAPAWVYAVALVVPVLVILASIWLASMTGAPTQPLPMAAWSEFLILIPIMLLAGPLPEELSFRGYGQHALQETMSPLIAALWIGIGVLIWHLPVLVTALVPWPFIVTIVAVSVVYAWLYQVGGSVWPLVVLHFSVNYFGGNWLGGMIAPAGQVNYALWFAAFYVAWVAILIWRYGPELGRKAMRG